MPTVSIEVKHKYTIEQEVAIIDAIHRAMMDGIKTPEWDKNIRLIVHEPHRFTGPPGKTERYTLVTFDMFSGHSIAREHPPENWGVQGGKPASDVDIGFKINV